MAWACHRSSVHLQWCDFRLMLCQVAKKLRIPVGEAQRLVQSFMRSFPRIEEFIERTKRWVACLLVDWCFMQYFSVLRVNSGSSKPWLVANDTCQRFSRKIQLCVAKRSVKLSTQWFKVLKSQLEWFDTDSDLYSQWWQELLRISWNLQWSWSAIASCNNIQVRKTHISAIFELTLCYVQHRRQCCCYKFTTS